MLDDQTFQAKYHQVIDIFREWMPGGYDFSKANILDFGCEHGLMALGIAMRLGAKKVVGVDINDSHNLLLDMVKDRLGLEKLPDNLEFHQVDAAEKLSARFAFDTIFTWSTFEHVSQTHLTSAVQEFYKCLAPGGYLFLQIAPLFYSAFGSHLQTVIDTPWAHLTMQHDLLRRVFFNAPKQGPYVAESDDNFQKIKESIWSTYVTLNKVTAWDILDLFEANGFKTLKRHTTQEPYVPSKSLARIYSKKVLVTDQIVVLFQKR